MTDSLSIAVHAFVSRVTNLDIINLYSYIKYSDLIQIIFKNIWLIDLTTASTTTLGQSGPEGNSVTL